MMNTKQIIFMNVAIALVFSLVMGFAMLYINAGFIPGFVAAWLESAIVGFIVALPLSFLIVPPIQKLSLRLFTSKERLKDRE